MTAQDVMELAAPMRKAPYPDGNHSLLAIYILYTYPSI
jgi:hypothetical protein